MDLEEAQRKIEFLEQENQELRARIAELERRLALDSGNSSKAPSSDGIKKRRHRTKSLREKSHKKSGGQVGHPGETLKSVPNPDVIVEYAVPEQCGNCGCDVRHLAVRTVVKRQVFDIAPPKLIVSEHQVGVKNCPKCHQSVQADFPGEIKAPVQYGPRIRAVAAYLHHQQFVPEDRLSEVLQDLFNCQMVPATTARITAQLGQTLQPVVEQIAKSLQSTPVKHLDETGFRLGKKTQWLHVVSSATQTWYRISAKRKDLEPLEGSNGVIVHDHWKPYFQLEGVTHALCHAHHLRELKAIEEIEQESWATAMSNLLKLACAYKNRAVDGIPRPVQARIHTLYHKILARGLAFHEQLPPLPKTSAKGRPKRRVGHNLLLRLKHYATDVLRFLSQTDVPFTNNQAERDLRMMKLKQKISGGFRSPESADAFATIRSVLSTARKQGLNLLDVLTLAVQGKIPLLT